MIASSLKFKFNHYAAAL